MESAQIIKLHGFYQLKYILIILMKRENSFIIKKKK